MALTDELRALFRDIAHKLKGHERRIFMARVVKLPTSNGFCGLGLRMRYG